jgi:hypothetical protein
MPEFTGWLFVPTVLVVSGLYTAFGCWWRRRQRRRGVGPADVFPGFRRFHASRPRRVSVETILAEELGLLREAETVVYAENARVPHLYVEPEEKSPGVRALEEAARAHSLYRP